MVIRFFGSNGFIEINITAFFVVVALPAAVAT
jgi:hypothetical protein